MLIKTDKTIDTLLNDEIERYLEDDAPALLKEETSYRVGTYNILTCRSFDPQGKFYNPETDYQLSWKFRKNIILEAIRKLDLDVIALQEVRSEQLDFLLENLPEFDVMGFSEHCGKSLNDIKTENLSADDVREIVPILFRKDKFKLINSQRWFLSDTPEVVSAAEGASRPRILVAGAFEYLVDNTIVVISNTHYDHKHNTEGLNKAGHLEAVFIDAYRLLFNAHDTVFLGDRNIDFGCDHNQWYRQFKQESNAKDTREAPYFGASTTFIGYNPDKFKASFNSYTGSFNPKVIDMIFYKGNGSVVKSLNSLVEYEVVEANKPSCSNSKESQVKLCSFFAKPKNPEARQFASDHSCVMADISHDFKKNSF